MKVTGLVGHACARPAQAERRIRRRQRMGPHCTVTMPRMLEGKIITGLRGSASLVVGEEHTAPSIGSGKVRVLATPVMINLIEAASLAAIEHLLPEGYQSLGTVLNVRHIAATPVGMKVRAIAEVVKVEGRTVFFAVECKDEKELIGDGRLERVVVNVAKFAQRVQRKLEER